MKTKKQLFKVLILLIGMIGFVACSEKTEDDNNTPAPPVGTSSLRVTPGKLNFTATGGTQELRIVTTYGYFGYDFTADWISADFKDDPTYNIITITAKPNTSPTARTATIKVTGSNSQTSIDETVNITIEQEGDSSSGEGKAFVIPAKGGTIEEGDLSITFPEGTFSSDTKVYVDEVKEGDIMGNAEVSKFYKTTLPANTNKPIKVSIKTDAKGDDIAMIAHSPSTSTHGQIGNYSDICLASTHSGGVYTVEIPAIENEGVTENIDISFGLESLPDNNSTRSNEYVAHTRSKDDGEIKWHKLWYDRWSDPNRSTINSDINDAMKEAVKIIKGLGFKVPGNRDIPLIFRESGLAYGEYGRHEQSKVFDSWNCITLNAPLLFGSNYSKEALRRTILHELFHYFQSAYDPCPSSFIKASGYIFRSVWVYHVIQIMEAGGVWIEKLVSNGYYDYGWKENGYYQVLRSPFEIGLMEGGAGDATAPLWGYGASLYFENISQRTSNDKIIKFYEEWQKKDKVLFQDIIKRGEAAIGVNLLGKGYLEDFENFILQLAEGRLITFSPYKDTSIDINTPFKFDIGWFELNAADKIKITEATTKTLKQKVYELGIRTGRVDLMSYKNSKGNADASKLSVNITQKNDNVYTYVYAYNQNTHKSNRLGKVENGKPLIIKDEKVLKQLLQKENYLYLMTALQVSPEEESEIEINVKEEEEETPSDWNGTLWDVRGFELYRKIAVHRDGKKKDSSKSKEEIINIDTYGGGRETVDDDSDAVVKCVATPLGKNGQHIEYTMDMYINEGFKRTIKLSFDVADTKDSEYGDIENLEYTFYQEDNSEPNTSKFYEHLCLTGLVRDGRYWVGTCIGGKNDSKCPDFKVTAFEWTRDEKYGLNNGYWKEEEKLRTLGPSDYHDIEFRVIRNFNTRK